MDATRAYVLYKSFFGLAIGFTMATYTPFLAGIGISLADIAFINAFFMATIWFMELPTGMLADGKSRIWSIRVGTLIYVIGGISYYCAGNITRAIVSEMIVGLGYAFISGADQAWLVDALHAEGKMSDRDRGRAFATSLMGGTAGMVFGGAIGGFVGEIDLRVPWLMMSVASLAAFMVSVRFMTHAGEPQHRVTEWQALLQSVHSLRKNGSLRWAVALMLISVFLIPFNHYWAIFFRSWVSQSAVGLIWIPLYGSMALAGFMLRSKRVRWSGAGASTYAVGIAGIGLAFGGVFSSLPIILLFLMLHELGRGTSEVLIDTFIQGHVKSQYRATFGSLRSFIRTACFTIGLGLFSMGIQGVETTQEYIVLIWIVSGTILAALASVLWLMKPRE